MKALLSELRTSETVLLLLDIGLKFTLLLAGLLLAVAVMHRVLKVSAAKRASLLWLGSAAIPIVAIAAFDDEKHPLSILEVEAAPLEAVSPPPVGVAETSTGKPLMREAINVVAPPVGTPSATAGPPPPVITGSPAPAAGRRPWHWLLGIWIGGITLGAMHLGIGIAMLNRRTRRFARAPESSSLFKTMANTARDLGLRRTPQLLVAGEDSTMPMTWGALRHRIVLPASASRWSPERLRLVLQHELSHVKRHDCLAGWAIRLLLAPAWFHPLAWVLARQATDLRERSCDDAVAKLNADIDRYAFELVELSRGNRGLTGAVAMARPRRLRARIVALYCPRTKRGAATGAFRSSALALLAICVIPMCLFCACQTTDVAPSSPVTGAGSASKPAHPWAENKIEITPKPVFKKGEKKVVLEAMELVNRGDLSLRETILLGSLIKLEAPTVSAADATVMPMKKGANIASITPFPTGRTHQFKITREFAYPVNPEADAADQKMTSRDVGVIGDALVKPLPDGKLSVVINFQSVEFVGFKADIAGVQRPEFTIRKIKGEEVIIENGGGLAPFLLLEEVQHGEDKVPLLGDLPLLGGLFRSVSGNRFRRMVMIRVQVTDP